MAVQGSYMYQQKTYVHMNTANKSFLDMHQYLKNKGIRNNNFFLLLLDPDLANIDPRDPNLSPAYKAKVMYECKRNFFYFIREVVRIPTQGAEVGGGARYQLHRGNLAMNFGFIKNWNMFVELPRQNFKTISAVVWYLWVFNYGTTNSEFMFINKKHDDSKMNLTRLKELREALPSYLRLDQAYAADGSKLKPKNTIETLSHSSNKNKISTLASARNKDSANGLGRGCTQPIQWYDEYAFIPYNGIVYLSATPAFKTASINAGRNGKPFGILITTTPGDLTTESGLEAYDTKNNATQFNEAFYDFTDAELTDLIRKNQNSSFVYMRFTYKQLGRDENWFREICIDMKKNWAAIRREVLLEWSTTSDNSPFTKEDLNIVKGFIREPIGEIMIRGFAIKVYNSIDKYSIPIVGVDVSGGFQGDSSAITIIDSKTTNVIGDFNCNYISVDEFAKVIYVLCTQYLPNAIINIERTGGYGSSLVALLLKTSLKSRLYYEIKDKVLQERVDHGRIVKQTRKTKVYGTDNTHALRNQLMEILSERMKYHKDKFVSPVIMAELESLEVKRSGRIEHSSKGHDDQIFSYLMALYVWYEGKHIRENFGIVKQSIRTDEEFDEDLFDLETQLTDITDTLNYNGNALVKQQLDLLNDGTKMYNQFMQEQEALDQQALNTLLSTKVGREAYAKKYQLDESALEGAQSGLTTISNDFFKSFYD